MTPALSLAFLAAPSGSAPLLPRTWRGRVVFTEEHVVALLATLSLGGAALGYAVRVACGLDARRGNDDAAAALAAACEACAALAADVARAESEGRARSLRRPDAEAPAVVTVPRVKGTDDDARVEAERAEEASPPRADDNGPRGSGAVHAPQGATATTTAQGRERWAEVARASAATEAGGARVEIVTDFADDYARVMHEARLTYGAGRLGLLRWIDARGQMMRPALHALDPLWLDAFAGYYDSRRLVMLARKGLRAGGSSSACPALTRCAIFADRRLDAGTIGVIPIMSATRDEADGRFVTIRSYLRAIGHVPAKKGKRGADEDFGGSDEPDEDGITYEVPPGGIAGVFQSKRSASGGGVIAIVDRHGHRIQFRILPALVKHGVGYTGAAGFADESDLWPNDPEHHVNPAEKILDRVGERFTTTHNEEREDPGAEFLVFSASYYPDSAFRRAVDDVILSERGERPKDRDPVMTAEIAHLVRLGAEGARRDEDARRRLAAALGSVDPRLLAPGDPTSPDLPAWVYNPSESIEKCLRFSKGSLSRMFGFYGGRAAEHSSDVCPLADVVPTGARRTHEHVDAAIGVSFSDDGRTWGIVRVAIDGAGHLRVTDDVSATLTDGRHAVEALARITGSVLACPRPLTPRLSAELSAAYAGGIIPPAPVAAVDIHDGPALRLGPLRTLYQRGRISHAVGLGALEAEARAALPEGRRCPRVEALSAAAARIVACYPHLGAGDPGEAVRGPRVGAACMVGGGVVRDADGWVDP